MNKVNQYCVIIVPQKKKAVTGRSIVDEPTKQSVACFTKRKASSQAISSESIFYS